MSRAGSGNQSFEMDAPHDAEAIPAELRSLLATISHQIEEADQRHTGLLQELRDRISALSREAETVRGSVPEAAGSAYARIENSLAQLAMHLEAVDDSHADPRAHHAADTPALAPAALKSAASPGLPGFGAHLEVGRPSAHGGAIDPFDLVGEDGDNDATGPWDEDSAEALTRVYEESDAALVRSSPRPEVPAAETAEALPDTAASRPHPNAMMTPAPAEAHGIAADRDWLDQRLSEIAVRIEQSLAELRPGLSMESLGERFDAFEERMGSVLGDVATRTDVESLRILEGQINELAVHLEQTESQLGRLDSIEQQLQAVIEHLAESHTTPAASGSAAAPDFQTLASSTAEEVAQRFAASLGGSASEHRFEEINGLLHSLMDDRRQSDEQTYSMLDTVQQAMIRLLDRIDALEVSQARSQTFGAHGHGENRGMSATDKSEDRQPEPAPAPVMALVEPPRYVETPVVAEDAAPAVPAAAPVQAAPAAVESRPTIDKLRQDFIADAQRAKQRAAAAEESESGTPVPVAPAKAARGLPRPKLPAPDPEAEVKAAAASRKQRLTALALCLVIALSGAALFAKSRSKSLPHAAPAPVTEVVPAIEVPGKPEAPAKAAAPARAPADRPANAAPVAPGAAASEGAFEVPADDAAAVPAPNPSPAPAQAPNAGVKPNAATPKGQGGPVTSSDALGIEGEVPESGEIIEQKFQGQHQGVTPEGILLQDSARQPTVQELAHLQSQQNSATLSSRLGSNAARLTPADLMPEEVAKVRAATISMPADPDVLPAQMAAVPASLEFNAVPGDMAPAPSPVQGTGTSASALSLPPATVGPLSLRIAAAKGDPSAAFEVGARLAEGKGTDQNFKEALTWYQRSASQGFAQAQYRLGTLYERGLGVKADVGRARMWYQRAAEQGNVKAMHNLAVLSAGRESGTPDYTTAAQWFSSAAEYGLADSQYNLAVLHENGLGVAKDLTLAYKWYALAAKSGDKESAKRRDAVAAGLDFGQRAEAERAAQGFVSQRIIPIVNDARVAGEDWKKREALDGAS